MSNASWEHFAVKMCGPVADQWHCFRVSVLCALFTLLSLVAILLAVRAIRSGIRDNLQWVPHVIVAVETAALGLHWSVLPYTILLYGAYLLQVSAMLYICARLCEILAIVLRGALLRRAIAPVAWGMFFGAVALFVVAAIGDGSSYCTEAPWVLYSGYGTCLAIGFGILGAIVDRKFMSRLNQVDAWVSKRRKLMVIIVAQIFSGVTVLAFDIWTLEDEDTKCFNKRANTLPLAIAYIVQRLIKFGLPAIAVLYQFNQFSGSELTSEAPTINKSDAPYSHLIHRDLNHYGSGA